MQFWQEEVVTFQNLFSIKFWIYNVITNINDKTRGNTSKAYTIPNPSLAALSTGCSKSTQLAVSHTRVASLININLK